MRVVPIACLLLMPFAISEVQADGGSSATEWVVEKRGAPASDQRLPPLLPGEEVAQGMKVWTTTGSVAGSEAPEVISTRHPLRAPGDVAVIVDDRGGRDGHTHHGKKD